MRLYAPMHFPLSIPCGLPGEALVKALDPVMQRMLTESKQGKALSKFKLVKLVHKAL